MIGIRLGLQSSKLDDNHGNRNGEKQEDHNRGSVFSHSQNVFIFSVDTEIQNDIFNCE